MLQWKFSLIIDVAAVVLRLFDGPICDVALIIFSMFDMRCDAATPILFCCIQLF